MGENLDRCCGTNGTNAIAASQPEARQANEQERHDRCNWRRKVVLTAANGVAAGIARAILDWALNHLTC